MGYETKRGVEDDSKYFDLSNWRIELSIAKTGEIKSAAGLGGKISSTFRAVSFEIFIRHLRGNAQKALGYTH